LGRAATQEVLAPLRLRLRERLHASSCCLLFSQHGAAMTTKRKGRVVVRNTTEQGASGRPAKQEVLAPLLRHR